MSHADRFLGRAEVYAAARPGYPAALGEWLRGRGLLSGGVADLGAGTGLFTRLLLDQGAVVTAVEPNGDMRAQLLGALDPFVQTGQLKVQAGTSEATGLEAGSVGLVTAAQAAHWFDPVPTVQEFRRVLRPGGQVLLVWNDWRGGDEPFNRAYGDVVRRHSAPDTPEVISRSPDPELAILLPGGLEHYTFENPLRLSRQRLRALAGSISYLPAPGDPQADEMGQDLDEIFDAHAAGGEVVLTYRTHAYLGQLD
ncbi:class I SAM-dependent methyltransferase [Deinococcus hohokamensis]|uniref:Class I SAM-dependent methyltransferase n=1 Tax=Deinococcus hohokamensis TaxID=309883 RepID=A0ABV9I4H0_9DEIO